MSKEEEEEEEEYSHILRTASPDPNYAIAGICFEVEAKLNQPLCILGLIVSLKRSCSFRIQTSRCCLREGFDPREVEWTSLFLGEREKGEQKVMFENGGSVEMEPGEKRCFFVYRTQNERPPFRVVVDDSFCDDCLILKPTRRLSLVSETGIEIPSFAPGVVDRFLLAGGLIYDFGCHLKPAKK